MNLLQPQSHRQQDPVPRQLQLLPFRTRGSMDTSTSTTSSGTGTDSGSCYGRRYSASIGKAPLVSQDSIRKISHEEPSQEHLVVARRRSSSAQRAAAEAVAALGMSTDMTSRRRRRGGALPLRARSSSPGRPGVPSRTGNRSRSFSPGRRPGLSGRKSASTGSPSRPLRGGGTMPEEEYDLSSYHSPAAAAGYGRCSSTPESLKARQPLAEALSLRRAQTDTAATDSSKATNYRAGILRQGEKMQDYNYSVTAKDNKNYPRATRPGPVHVRGPAPNKTFPPDTLTKTFAPAPTWIPKTPARPATTTSKTPTHKSPIMVEIEPGVKVPLRDKQEIMDAISCNFITETNCLNCTMQLYAIQDVQFYTCPICKVISPLFGGMETEHGVAMGVTEQILREEQCKQLLMQEGGY